MQSNIKLEEIEKKLPHGAKKNISEKTGFTQKTVINALKGKSVKSETFKTVVEAAKAIIKERDELLNF
ncbi:hypothetical protein N4T20_18160 [Flavobacterium sp. TR2]|uniref:hypothetical protein n=1 Tax=Flavobacterium sp. TR2 TaxID=2977321 RepID=UPI0021B0E441|nr:hypothetical protein [Flavobacterium sp. TR2]UWY27643.1 hypothetical protein N4T20_18160 [Flavobacterium sp. TR2]